ncbi:putative neurogenic locus notch like protein 2 [Xylogone sp. PMI_703]|nr:putative neurogenic locus notch like protein 2 [Xylogone sp. PMI_703]
MAAASIDIDRPAKYPIVLSDALLGKPSKDLYSSVRYNHKPDDAPDSTFLQPSDSDPTTYDVTLSNGSDQYVYNGARTTGDGKYVLIFDPAKKHFVLHRLDSTFDMNLIKTPWEENESSLRSEYPQLETTSPSQQQKKQSKATKARGSANAAAETKQRKAEKPAKKTKPKARSPTPESDADDSDDGLTIEYPDGSAPTQYRYQSTPVFQREPSEEVSEEDSGDEQDYRNERNQDVDVLELSPANNNDMGGITEEDMELDLEAELEQALQETTVEMTHSANESDESEEE